MNGTSVMTYGGHFPVFKPMFDLSNSFWMVKVMFITRNPIPIISFGQITAPFSSTVWTLSALLVMIVGLMHHITYKLYQKPYIQQLDLAKREHHPANFYLFSLAKLTEPDPLPWFKKWSAGKIFSLLWTLFCLLMVLFYTCNLRAHLITVNYEESPETLDHIIDRGTVPYMYRTLRNGYTIFIAQ